MKFSKLLQKLNKIFLPSGVVSGLQITNSALRFLHLKLDRGNLFVVKNASLRLPPGIIESGAIKDRANFVSALNKLHGQIEVNPQKNINVILTIPTGDVYAQAFNVPAIQGENFEEAVKLNLQVISPVPLDQTYYSWKVVGDTNRVGGQRELLGVFVQKEIIDGFVSCLEEAGFGVAGIEFSSLSMARLLYFYRIINKDSSYLLVKMTQEGLIFMILRNGNLYFDYFHSWDKFTNEGKGVTIDAINAIIYAESQRVLNFYSSHWGGQIKKIILITPALIKEIAEFLKSSYPSFEIAVLSSDKENLHGVKGAALRGLVSTPLDPDINLMNPEGMNAFYQDQSLVFIKFWASIAVTVMVFLFAIFGSADFFLNKYAETAAANMNVSLSVSDAKELSVLQADADKFNGAVGFIEKYKGESYSLSSLLASINGVLDSGIIVSRIFLGGSDNTGALEGLAKDQDTFTSFKNRLSNLPNVSDVNLPLSNINAQSNGEVYFSLTFKLKK